MFADLHQAPQPSLLLFRCSYLQGGESENGTTPIHQQWLCLFTGCCGAAPHGSSFRLRTDPAWFSQLRLTPHAAARTSDAMLVNHATPPVLTHQLASVKGGLM